MDLVGDFGSAAAILVTVGASVVAVLVVSKARREAASMNALLVTGEPAEATVVQAEDAGVVMDGVPLIRLLLDVRRVVGSGYRPGPQAYRIETKALVPELKFPQVQPGAQIAVRLDPSDPTRVAVALR